MWFRKTKEPPSLTEDLVQRVWDCSSRLEQLEDRFKAQLDDLSVRYRRAEQSEKRLEDKRAPSPCEEEAAAESPQLRALKKRQMSGSGVTLNRMATS